MTARWRQIHWSRLPFAASLGRRDLERLDSPQIRPPSRSDSWHKMDSKCHHKGLFWFFFSFCLFVFLFGYWFLFYILWLLHHWSRSCNSVAAASSGKFDVANFQISPPSRSTCLLDLCVCVLQGEWGGGVDCLLLGESPADRQCVLNLMWWCWTRLVRECDFLDFFVMQRHIKLSVRGRFAKGLRWDFHPTENSITYSTHIQT